MKKALFVICLLASNLLFCQKFSDSTKYYVKLFTGETLYGASSYERPFFGKPVIEYKGQDYAISKIHSVSNEDGFFMTFIDSGTFRVDYNLAKRTTEGKIDLYSDYYTTYEPMTMSANGVMTGGGGSSHYDEIYFSRGNGRLYQIEYSTLADNLNDNLESMQKLNLYNNLRYWKYGLVTAGIIMVITGLAQIDKEEGLTSGAKSTMILGAVVANLAWIPALMQGQCLKDALKIYNR